jgi:hypothetical protein
MYKVAHLEQEEDYQMGTPLKLLARSLSSPRVPFVEKIAYIGTSTLLAAAPTAGKSAIIRSLIAASLKKEKFLGKFRTRRAYHLYYDGEGGQDTIYSLLDLMGTKFGDELPDPFETEWDEYKERCQERGRDIAAKADDDENLKLLEQYVRLRPFVPGGLSAQVVRRDVEALRREVGDEAIIVVYIDTFRTWHAMRPDYQENDNSFLAAVVSEYSKLAKEVNISLWMLHHTKKDGQGVAGGTYMEGGNDGVILYRKDGEENDAPRILDVRRMSRGDSTALPPIGVVRDAATGNLTAIDDPEDLKNRRLLKSLAKAYKDNFEYMGRFKKKDLKLILGLKDEDTFIAECIQAGLLEKDQLENERGKPYVFFLTDKARREILFEQADTEEVLDTGFFPTAEELNQE